MRNSFRRFTAIIITVSIFIVCAGAAFTGESSASKLQFCYTALGDSIAAGYGVAQGQSYVSLFNDYLKFIAGAEIVKMNNLAKTGDTSSDLLKKLQGDSNVINTVKKSNIVTLSIGGNNLLSAVAGTVSKAFNVNPVDNPNLAKDLSEAMVKNPNKDLIIAGLMKSDELPKELANGVIKFSSDWPKIIAAIKTLAPGAEIYAMNIYNPLNQKDPLYSNLDIVIRALNNVIGTSNGKYNVVDTYSLFRSAGSTAAVTNFNLLAGALDPHPSAIGHEMIFKAHVNAFESKDTKGQAVLTRGELIKMLVSSLNLKASFNSNFDDVSKDASYYQAVGIVRKLGLIKGVGGNKFNPGGKITRQDTIVLLSKLLTVTGKNLARGTAKDLAEYSDASEVSPYAVESVAALIKSGIVVVNGKINPKGNITYGQVLQIIGNIKAK